jgi:hypothetical protein
MTSAIAVAMDFFLLFMTFFLLPASQTEALSYLRYCAVTVNEV